MFMWGLSFSRSCLFCFLLTCFFRFLLPFFSCLVLVTLDVELVALAVREEVADVLDVVLSFSSVSLGSSRIVGRIPTLLTSVGVNASKQDDFAGFEDGSLLDSVGGLSDGIELGLGEGWLLGSQLGLLEGIELGSEDSWLLGSRLGLLLGRELGWALDCELGSDDGSLLGSMLGLCDGFELG
jgi:hypothetical protein